MSSGRVADLSWDHNAWYHRRMLRELPRRPDRVLDVGCGAGTFATLLARRASHVDAVDRAAHMVELARAVVPDEVVVREADVMTAPLPAGFYDAVTSVSVLHHLDLATALPRLAATLRPGGVLVATALPRVDLPRESAVEVIALAADRVVAGALRLGEVATGRRPFGREPTHDVMPVEEPTLTVREVRAVARAVLPGAHVRRLLFWRYLLVWRKPLTGATSLTRPTGTRRRRSARRAPGCRQGR